MRSKIFCRFENFLTSRLSKWNNGKNAIFLISDEIQAEIWSKIAFICNMCARLNVIRDAIKLITTLFDSRNDAFFLYYFIFHSFFFFLCFFSPFQCQLQKKNLQPNIDIIRSSFVASEKWNEIHSQNILRHYCNAIYLILIDFQLRHNDTPVVRASGRELSYVLLAGIIMCYSVTFALVLRPTDIICGIQR